MEIFPGRIGRSFADNENRRVETQRSDRAGHQRPHLRDHEIIIMQVPHLFSPILIENIHTALYDNAANKHDHQDPGDHSNGLLLLRVLKVHQQRCDDHQPNTLPNPNLPPLQQIHINPYQKLFNPKNPTKLADVSAGDGHNGTEQGNLDHPLQDKPSIGRRGPQADLVIGFNSHQWVCIFHLVCKCQNCVNAIVRHVGCNPKAQGA